MVTPVKDAFQAIQHKVTLVALKTEVTTLEYQRRLLIALKSPLQSLIDSRHRCEDCGRVLTLHDFHTYWDGSVELERTGVVPRCCTWCAEDDSLDRF